MGDSDSMTVLSRLREPPPVPDGERLRLPVRPRRARGPAGGRLRVVEGLLRADAGAEGPGRGENCIWGMLNSRLHCS